MPTRIHKDMPPDLQKQVLTEAGTPTAAKIMHACEDLARKRREDSKIPAPWTGRATQWRERMHGFLLRRWAKWELDPPIPLPLDTLAQLMDEGVDGARTRHGVPLKPADVVTALETYLAAGNGEPTPAELASYIHRPAYEVENLLFTARGKVVRNHETGTYRLEKPLLDWSSTSGQPYPEPVNPIQPGRNAHMPQGFKNLLCPQNIQDLLQEVWGLKAQGVKVTPILTRKYQISSAGLWGLVARARVERGLPQREECKRCFDTGREHGRMFGAVCNCDRGRKLAEQSCQDCNDTGFVGGGDSGPVCGCVKGIAIAQAITDGIQLAAQLPYIPPKTDEITPEERVQMNEQRVQADAIGGHDPVDGVVKCVMAYDEEQRELAPLDLTQPPIIHILERDGKIRTLTCPYEDPWCPSQGNEWPEPVFTNGNRIRYRVWLCWQESKLEDERKIFFMVPPEGVTLKPEEVA